MNEGDPQGSPVAADGALRWRALGAPLGVALVAAGLTQFVTDRPEQAAAMARGIAGPISWPTWMLWAVSFFAAMWALQVALRIGRGQFVGANRAPPVPARIWLGIVLVVAYGASLPWLGFALATFVYLLLWLLVGGERSPLRVGITTVVGTLGLLYLFVKVALMPLDRGTGAIGEATVVLYRWLGIY